MLKMKDINEAVDYLLQAEVLTSDGKDLYIYKNEKIHCFSDGTHFSLNIKDFSELYKKNSFYLYEETVEIDLDKDEAYYRYYKK